MIEFTPDGIILDANPAFLGVVNYRLEEIVGKHHRLFCSRNLSESLAYQQFWQRLRQGEHFSDRFPRLTQDGKEVWLEATYMPIRDDQGLVTKVMKIGGDRVQPRGRGSECQPELPRSDGLSPRRCDRPASPALLPGRGQPQR
nr:PAS domain-containing protein [Pseudomonas sp. NFACC19-2]